MRLFIALTLPEAVRQRLLNIMGALRADGVRGNFTRPENLHLTLHFLGEQPPAAVDALTSILADCARERFTIACAGLGVFERSGILWAGVTPSVPLGALHARLSDQLIRHFPVEQRPYRPHLTLAREYALPNSYALPTLEPVSQMADEVCLMESRRENGRLLYRPLAAIALL